MSNSEEQKEDVGIDPYLESPKVFHLEMPLYRDFDLSDKVVAERIFELLSYDETIDSYCIWCKKDGVFKAYSYLRDNTITPSWTARHNGLIEIWYRCARHDSHVYRTYYFKSGKFFTKAGQFPSVADFQIPQVETYRKILEDNQYKELTKGIGLSAHGIGIGSFVYLRRVFENLIENAHIQAKTEVKDFSESDYDKARMDEKIKMVKDCLPEFLVENRALYAIMSKGIHELSEDECLQYFETVKIGIEQILDEKIIQKDKAEKAMKAREAIQKTHGKLASS